MGKTIHELDAGAAVSATNEFEAWQGADPSVRVAASQIKTYMLRIDGATGVGAPLLGVNSPAGTLSAPYTWLKFQAADGTQVYVPAWA